MKNVLLLLLCWSWCVIGAKRATDAGTISVDRELAGDSESYSEFWDAISEFDQCGCADWTPIIPLDVDVQPPDTPFPPIHSNQHDARTRDENLQALADLRAHPQPQPPTIQRQPSRDRHDGPEASNLDLNSFPPTANYPAVAIKFTQDAIYALKAVFLSRIINVNSLNYILADLPIPQSERFSFDLLKLLSTYLRIPKTLPLSFDCLSFTQFQAPTHFDIKLRDNAIDIQLRGLDLEIKMDTYQSNVRVPFFTLKLTDICLNTTIVPTSSSMVDETSQKTLLTSGFEFEQIKSDIRNVDIKYFGKGMLTYLGFRVGRVILDKLAKGFLRYLLEKTVKLAVKHHTDHLFSTITKAILEDLDGKIHGMLKHDFALAKRFSFVNSKLIITPGLVTIESDFGLDVPPVDPISHSKYDDIYESPMPSYLNDRPRENIALPDDLQAEADAYLASKNPPPSQPADPKKRQSWLGRWWSWLRGHKAHPPVAPIVPPPPPTQPSKPKRTWRDIYCFWCKKEKKAESVSVPSISPRQTPPNSLASTIDDVTLNSLERDELLNELQMTEGVQKTTPLRRSTSMESTTLNENNFNLADSIDTIPSTHSPSESNSMNRVISDAFSLTHRSHTLPPGDESSSNDDANSNDRISSNDHTLMKRDSIVLEGKHLAGWNCFNFTCQPLHAKTTPWFVETQWWQQNSPPPSPSPHLTPVTSYNSINTDEGSRRVSEQQMVTDRGTTAPESLNFMKRNVPVELFERVCVDWDNVVVNYESIPPWN